MTVAIVLTCDNCGTTEREQPPAPLYGWLHVQPARRSEIESIPEAKADFCCKECAVEWLEALTVQAHMAMFDSASITPETADKAAEVLEDTPIEAAIKAHENGATEVVKARVAKARKRESAKAS